MTPPATRPHIGFKLPNCGGVMCNVEWATPANVVRLAGMARDLGYDSVWLHDHTVTPRELQHLDEPPFYEPLVVMAAIAGQVPDIVVGVATLILPFRDPVLLTKQMLYLEGATRTLAPEVDLLEEQQLIFAALAAKHPALASLL